MNTKTFLKLELKNFLSERAIVVAVLFLMLAGVYAMFHGMSVIDRQKSVIAEVPAAQAEHLKKQLELQKEDLGNLLYYLQHSTVDAPSSWAAFAVGQRDVNPYLVKVKMLTLENQIYDSEMSNPTNLLYGNFDLSFVIVFLLPLLIIAFCHNLISAEQENGIWNLLRSQPVSLAKIVGWRLLIRFAAVLLIAFALITASGFYLESRFDARFLYALFIAFAYLAFWLALTAFVISFGKSSTFNALTLLGAWIFLTILAPALLNLVISTAFPVSESFEVTVKQREGYHEKWDKPKAETMAHFFAKYPEYKNFPIPEDKFSWGWYYAMNEMGDLDAADATAEYMEKLRTRDSWTSRAAAFLPTVSTQLAFNSLAKNDLLSHLAYLESVRQFHARVREYFYPYIFQNAAVEQVDWQNVPRHEFGGERQTPVFPGSVWLILLFAALLAIAAGRNFKSF